MRFGSYVRSAVPQADLTTSIARASKVWIAGPGAFRKPPGTTLTGPVTIPALAADAGGEGISLAESRDSRELPARLPQPLPE